MCMVEFPFNEVARLHSTVYYRTKIFITETFLEVLRKENISLFSNVTDSQFISNLTKMVQAVNNDLFQK